MDRPARLTREFVENVSDPGRYGDGLGGNGLSLRVRRSRDGQKLYKGWEQRIYAAGRVTTIGMGSYPRRKLTAARARAAEAVQRIRAKYPRETALDRLLAAEVDAPVLGQVVAASVEQPRAAPPFSEVAEQYIESSRSGWKSGSKTEKQARSLLHAYVLPVVGEIPINRVTPGQVHDVLAPIWHPKAESAKKVRRLVKACFAHGIAKGYLDTNPVERADVGLRKQRNVTTYSAAVPHEQVREVIDFVRASQSYASKKQALEFLILTGARTSEVRGMRVDEIDYRRRTWTIPASRMKGGREHRVPLSSAAMGAIWERIEHKPDGSLSTPTGLVFTDRSDRMLSQDGLRQLLKRGYPDATSHGFRSSFRDWAAEKTDYPSEVVEHALAHLVGSTTVRSYLRTDMFEKRRELMADWAEYVTGEPRQL